MSPVGTGAHWRPTGRAWSSWVALLAFAGLAGACGAESASVPASSLADVQPLGRSCAVDAPQDAPLDDTIVAAYPDEPAAFLPAMTDQAAAIDLAALWGLPLYDYDDDGQLRPRLLREAIVLGEGPGGWDVRLVLCDGTWSDGQPVVAGDIVATVQALRETDLASRLASVADVRVDGPDVVVSFAGRTPRWQHVLAELGTMLPAHVIGAEGLDAWRDGIPVSGGPWRLESAEPGLRWTFVAHEGSPLGAPTTRRLEVLLVPRFELALGLLDAGDVDVALGHLAIEVAARVEDVGGLSSADPIGGTLMTWQWQDGASIQDPTLRGQVVQSFDLEPFADGLLSAGGVTSSWLPGQPGPDVEVAGRLPESVPELVVASARWHEIPSLVTRAVRDSIERRGGTVRTASDEADQLERAPLGDARVTIRRVGPWPSLAWWAGEAALPAEVTAAVEAADRAPSPAAPEVLAGQQALRPHAVEVPLVEVGVSHVWRPSLTGLVPSAWPGIGFTSATEWSIGGEPG